MRRAAQLCLGSSLLALVLVAWAGTSDSQTITREVAPTVHVALRQAPPAATTHAMDQYVGAGSCSSTACHGGPPGTNVLSPEDSHYRSSYTTWVTEDAHARAFSVLYGARSKQIAKNLATRTRTEFREAYRDTRCLACHAPSAEVTAIEIVVADGVSCENCHGAARGWLDAHTTGPADSSAQARREYRERLYPLGLLNTVDLVSRAKVCVSCHVGSPDKAAGGGDMNHDMIAAGHPRLQFEYAANLANMPPHWNLRRERRDARADSASAWQIGQIATAQAAAQLLETRAATKHLPWPEFSEYDCFTCHHGLTDTSFRQNTGAHHPLGTYAWGTWTFASLASAEGGGLKLPTADIDVLRKHMQQLAPDRETAQKAAAQTAAAFEGTLSAIKPGGDNHQRVRQMLANVIAHGKKSQVANWDEATQLYLALRAISEADPELSQPGSTRGGQLREKLASIRESLRFRRLTIPTSATANENLTFDSPDQFNPEELSLKFQEVLELIETSLRE